MNLQNSSKGIRMTDKEYLEKAKYIWKTLVPSRGQADTVQGELLRAIASLQDEAQRNGNCNWDDGHEIQANYLLEVIENSKMLEKKKLKQFKHDIARLLKFKSPYLENDLYKRITHIVVDFYMKYPDPIKHKYNIDLHR